MIIKKNIEVAVDISDPIGLYTDPNNILYILANKFEGRCYRGCYITKINRIIRMGDCIINQDGSPNFGILPVIMEVTAVVYSAGEVINGAVVQNKDKSGIITCNTDTACILLMGHTLLSSITSGQIISIRVRESKYSQGSDKISISAIPYLFANKSAVYKLGPLSSDFKVLAEGVMERITAEEEARDTLQKTKALPWRFFDNILYGYSTEQKPPPGATPVGIMDIINGVKSPIYISQDERLNGSSAQVYAYTKEQFPEKSITLFEIPPDCVMLNLLESYCGHLRTIREMIEIYNTEALVASHRNLWQIFKKARLD